MSLIFHPAYLQFSPCYSRSCPFISFRTFSLFGLYSFFYYLCQRNITHSKIATIMKKIYYLMLVFSLIPLLSHAEDVVVGEEKFLSINVGSAVLMSSTWFSDNPSDVSVISQNGLSCIIRGNRADGHATVECDYTYRKIVGNVVISTTRKFYIHVKDNKPTSVTVYQNGGGDLLVGSNISLYAEISPEGADYQHITWVSSNTNVATVNGNETSASVYGASIGSSTITATTINGKKGSYTVNVYGTNPTNVSISGKSTIDAEEQAKYTASFTPSNHRSVLTWDTSDHDIATVNSIGTVTGIKPGTTTLKVTTANGISDTKEIVVKAPQLRVAKTKPTQNETGYDVTSRLFVYFSHDIFEDSKFENIALFEGTGTGEKVETNNFITIDGNTKKYTVLAVSPIGSLKPNTNYNLHVPVQALKNKWGGTTGQECIVNFRTGELKNMTLTMKKVGKKVYLECSEYTADIRFTLDGSEPTLESGIPLGRSEVINLEKNTTLWAKAYLDGYTVPEIKRSLSITMPNVEKLYPSEDEHPFAGHYLFPYVEFDKDISWGKKSSSLYVTQREITNYYYLSGEFFITKNRLIFIPDERVEDDLKIHIPAGTVVGANGEGNEAYDGTFGTKATTSSELTAFEMVDPVLYMQPGDTAVVLVKPVPLNANYAWSWSSSNEDVATTDLFSWEARISNMGVVKAKSEGMATITVKCLSSDIEASCTIFVGKVPESAPKLVKTSPEDGATDVPLNVRPFMKFSEYTDLNRNLAGFDYLKIMLSDANGNFVERDRGVEVTGSLFQLTPSEDLQPNMQYTMSIPAGYLRNIETGAVSAEEFSFSFTTGDPTGIRDLTVDKQLFDIYNLQGHKVRSKVSTTDGLPKGIYIINGKKIII